MSLLTRLKSQKVTPIAGGKPKVLIGVSAFNGVVAKAQESFFELAYHLGRRCPEYDFLLKIMIKREQFRARNNLVDLAIINGCDYFFMLDDDMVVPVDTFSRLVAHNKDVVGCLYWQRGGAFHPVIMKRYMKADGLVGIDFLHPFDPMVVNRGLYKIDGVLGGGCILFKTEVFNRIPQPYFWIDGIVGTDVHVCQQLHNADIELWVDTTIELGHVGEEQVITSRTVPKYSRTLGVLNEELWEDMKAHTGMDNLQLESAIFKAANTGIRKEHWAKEPRDTWEGVRRYYQDFGDWHVLNLVNYNLQFDQARDWVINSLETVAKPGATIADVGCGVGYCTLALARAGYQMTGLDLASTPTLEFLRWRLARHNVSASLLAFEEPVPPDLPEKQDGILMISVFDHLWDPLGMLAWVERNLKRGGFMVNDTLRNLPMDDEPQHLIKYNPHQMVTNLRRRGWKDTPDNPFLFFWEG